MADPRPPPSTAAPAAPAEPAAPGLSAAPRFADLGLAPALAAAAAAAGWAVPTPIQEAALPAVLEGRDLLGLAPTGAGKTAAYLLPLLQRLQPLHVPAGAGDAPAQRRRRLRTLVLAPTRELALQVGAVAQQLAQGLAPAPRVRVVVGGVSINPQMMALRGGTHLLVATPGRLLDLLDQRALRLDEVEHLVLDEADRLLDLGFAEELGRVLAALPARRQTLLFTATMPDDVAALAQRALRADALRVEAPAGSGCAVPRIVQRAIVVDSAQRTPLLRHLIQAEGWDRVLVFVATQYGTEHLADKLGRAGITAAALHGQLSQGRRSQVLADFQRGALKVLVATDLAARGLDVAGLAAVVHYDLPRSAVDYTHRNGRTGRAGRPGVAVALVCADAPGSEAHFRLIEKRQGERVAREQQPGFEPAARALPAAPADAHGGVKGRRKSRKDKLRAAAMPRQP